MSAMPPSVPGLISRFASRLRFPQLLVVTALLFVVDLFIPDMIPLVDEVLLGLATLLFATWKKRKSDRGSCPQPTTDGTDSGRVVDVSPTDTDG